MKKFTIYFYIIIISLYLLKFSLCIIFEYHITQVDSNNKYHISIDIETHKLNLYEDNKLIKTYKIGCGKHSTPSPVGKWTIVDKSKWGGGFGGSWMKLNVPWGDFGIHGTKFPYSIGYDVSHGCIRMYSKEAEELYEAVPIGTSVIISNGKNGPFDSNQRVIQPGNTGSDVLAIQEQLSKLGYYNGNFDGIYGNQLKKALFDFQKSRGYKPHHDITKWDLRLMGFEQIE